jgi:uncharacterized membrane protein (DUF4010 family)
MNLNPSTLGIFTALCIGFLIGIVRERLHQHGTLMAGVRTHTLAALIGAVAISFGTPIFLAALVFIGVLIAIGYAKSYRNDPGMTGEVSLGLTVLLGGLAVSASDLAAAMGVAVAGLLFLKKPLRKFSQELLSEKELEDALVLFAAALIILPIMPQDAIDPWGTFKPFDVWKIVVVIMSAGMLGHLAVRVTGMKWGLPIASFFSGFVSSTAVIMDLGRRAKEVPVMLPIACASSLLSTLASLVLFSVVLATSSMPLFKAVAWPLCLGGLALFLASIAWLKRDESAALFTLPATEGAFQIKHVAIIAASISGVSLLATWMGFWFGQPGTFVSAILVGFAEIHSAAVAIATLNGAQDPASALAKWGVIGILAASVVAKSVLSLISGGKTYAAKIGLSLTMFITASVLGMLL